MVIEATDDAIRNLLIQLGITTNIPSELPFENIEFLKRITKACLTECSNSDSDARRMEILKAYHILSHPEAFEKHLSGISLDESWQKNEDLIVITRNLFESLGVTPIPLVPSFPQFEKIVYDRLMPLTEKTLNGELLTQDEVQTVKLVQAFTKEEDFIDFYLSTKEIVQLQQKEEEETSLRQLNSVMDSIHTACQEHKEELLEKLKQRLVETSDQEALSQLNLSIENNLDTNWDTLYYRSLKSHADPAVLTLSQEYHLLIKMQKRVSATEEEKSNPIALRKKIDRFERLLDENQKLLNKNDPSKKWYFKIAKILSPVSKKCALLVAKNHGVQHIRSQRDRLIEKHRAFTSPQTKKRTAPLNPPLEEDHPPLKKRKTTH